MDGDVQIDVGRGEAGERGDMHRGRTGALRETAGDAQGASLTEPWRAERRTWGAFEVVRKDGLGHLEGADVHLATDDPWKSGVALVKWNCRDMGFVARVDGGAGGD